VRPPAFVIHCFAALITAAAPTRRLFRRCSFLAILLPLLGSCDRETPTPKTQEPPPSLTFSIPANSARPAVPPPRPADLQALKAAIATAKTLTLEQLSDISSNFAALSPEDIAQIFRKLPVNCPTSFVLQYREFLRNLPVTDTARVIAHLAALPGGDTKQNILEDIIEQSGHLRPETLKQFLSVCHGEEDLGKLTLALDRQLHHRKPEEIIALAQQYLDLDPPAVVATRMIGLAVDTRLQSGASPAALADWILAQPANLASGGDKELIQFLTKSDPALATGYVQRVVDLGSLGRAELAIVFFSSSYSQTSPVEALAWANQLPDSLKEARTNAITHAYTAIQEVRPHEAGAALKTISDPDALKRLKMMSEAP
jgi:hypothetical protein